MLLGIIDIINNSGIYLADKNGVIVFVMRQLDDRRYAISSLWFN